MRPWSVIINGRLFQLWLQLQESLSRWMLRPVLAERRWRQLSTLVAQGTTVRCREGSEMPEHTAGIGFSPELTTSGVRRVTGWCVLKISRAMAFNTDCNLSKIWGHASQDRVAVINFADSQCADYGQQGLTHKRALYAAFLQCEYYYYYMRRHSLAKLTEYYLRWRCETNSGLI